MLGALMLAAMVRGELPEPLRKIEPGRTTRAQVRLALGKPALARGGAEFHELRGVRYDTTVGYRGDKVEYVFHRAAGSRLEFEAVTPWITERHREAIERQLNPKKPTHETGRHFTVEFPREGLRLKFDGGEARRLHSVVITRAEGARK
jgi:hypothetical protein